MVCAVLCLSVHVRCGLALLASAIARLFDVHAGGSIAYGVFRCNIRGGQRCQCRALAPGSWSCTVAILAQGTSWAVAVTQAFFMCDGGHWEEVWLVVLCGLAPWTPAVGAQLARTHVLGFL